MIVISHAGRVISIGNDNKRHHVLPSGKSKPFVVGFFHGKGKPNIKAFLFDLIEELNFLHPDSPSSKGRKMTVLLRALICDAVGRFWIKGTTSNSGYYCCERCDIK
jgi:hypothetical protein